VAAPGLKPLLEKSDSRIHLPVSTSSRKRVRPSLNRGAGGFRDRVPHASAHL
jgi:hypothetical protein